MKPILFYAEINKTVDKLFKSNANVRADAISFLQEDGEALQFIKSVLKDNYKDKNGNQDFITDQNILPYIKVDEDSIRIDKKTMKEMCEEYEEYKIPVLVNCEFLREKFVEDFQLQTIDLFEESTFEPVTEYDER